MTVPPTRTEPNDLESGEREATDRALQLFVVLNRCFDSVAEHARRDIFHHRLSVSEFGVLEMLHRKGSLSLGKIAEKILLTTGSITYVIDQLEGRSLVRRVACPTDRRRLYAELTEQGSRLITEIFPAHELAIQNAAAGLTLEEQETAIQLLKKLGLAARLSLENTPLTKQTQKSKSTQTGESK